MAAIKPLRVDSTGQVAQAQSGEFVDLPNGGTGATSAAGARTALGLAIGTDVQAYSTDANALHALNTTVGIPVRTASNTWAMRQVAVASTARLTVTNPAGTAGDITLDLATLTDSGVGSFLKITRDAYGRISGSTAVVQADITGLVGGVYAPINNPTFTGTVTLAADPASALQAATKQYVDAVAATGVAPWQSVDAVATSNITLSGTQTIDGVALIAGKRVLCVGQTTASANGIYVVAAGAWSRATDADAAAEFVSGKQVYVNVGGTAYAGSVWANTNTSAITIGTTSITFTQINGLNSTQAGSGLASAGNVISVGTASSARIVVNADNIDLASGVIASPGTFTKVTVDTYGRVTVGATAAPSDIGAQASDAALTSIAALTGAGSLHFSATDVAVMRQLATGSSSRITVTNGDGAAGNPTIDLASGVVTPGTYQSVTVDTYGRVTAGTTSSSNVLTDSLTNGEASSIAIGRAVYASASGAVKLANANSSTTTNVVGIVASTSISSAASGSIAVAGVIDATTAQWDAVTGQTGGLTFGAKYYLSNVTAGALTSTPPSSGFIAPVGIALSTTKLRLNVDPTIQL